MPGPSPLPMWSPTESGSRSGLFAAAPAIAPLAIRAVVVLLVAAGWVLLFSQPAMAADDLMIEKMVNGLPADSSPGVAVAPGAKVSYTYRVTVNNADGLYDIQVLDSDGIVPNCDTDGDGQPDGSNVHQGPVDAGQSFTCTADHQAGSNAGTFASIGIAKANNFFGTSSYEASDPAHYTVRPPTTRPTTTRPTSTRQTSARPTSTRPTTTVQPSTIAPGTDRPSTSADGQTSSVPTSETGDDIIDDAAGTDAEPERTTITAQPIARSRLLVESMVNGQTAESAPGPFVETREQLRLTHMVVNAGQNDLLLLEIYDSLGSKIACYQRDAGSTDSDLADSSTTGDTGRLAVPFDLAPGQSALCESLNVSASLPEVGAVEATVTATAQSPDGFGAALGPLSAADTVYAQLGGDITSVPDELAMTDLSTDDGQRSLHIPWVLVPGLIILLAGGAFLLGLVHRLDS